MNAGQIKKPTSAYPNENGKIAGRIHGSVVHQKPHHSPLSPLANQVTVEKDPMPSNKPTQGAAMDTKVEHAETNEAHEKLSRGKSSPGQTTKHTGNIPNSVSHPVPPTTNQLEKRHSRRSFDELNTSKSSDDRKYARAQSMDHRRHGKEALDIGIIV